MLTDGSYQLVRTYERIGERVRYYSVERSEWEEVPAAMVDWEATKKAEVEAQQKMQQLDEKEKDIRTVQIAEEVDVASSLEIAPGVFLPDKEGLYVLEGTSTRTLDPAEAGVKLNKTRMLEQILSPVKIVPSQHRVELPGAHAGLRLTTAHPEFYVRTKDDHEPELELIRAKVKGNVRQIESISTYITGDKERYRDAISVERWKIARGVYRITMSQSLEPGEYVLAEVMTTADTQELSLGVWDFGVDAQPGPAAKPKPPSKH